MTILLEAPACYRATCDRCGVSALTDSPTRPPQGWANIHIDVVGNHIAPNKIVCSDCVQAFDAVWTSKKTTKKN